MNAKKKSSSASLREELDAKIALLDECYMAVIGLNAILHERGFEPDKDELPFEDESRQSAPSASFKELRARIETVLRKLEGARRGLSEAQKDQRAQSAISSELHDIIVEGLQRRD